SSKNKKSNSGGRPRAEVWDSYIIDAKNEKYSFIRCKYYSRYLQRNRFMEIKEIALQLNKSWKELEYYGKDLTEEELWTIPQILHCLSLISITRKHCENFKPQSKPTSSKGRGNMASNIVYEVLGLEDDNN
ncbi:10854_t:CDS:2, partial [Scutellospora calospora]